MLFRDHDEFRQRLRETLFGITMILAAGFFAFIVIPAGVTNPSSVDHLPLSPRFLPYVLIILIAIIAIIHVAEAWLAPHPPNTLDNDKFIPHAHWKLRVVYLSTLLLGYLLLPAWGGMLMTAILITVALTALGGERRPFVLLGVGVVIPVIVYFFFIHAVQVPMPQGTIFEEWINYD